MLNGRGAIATFREGTQAKETPTWVSASRLDAISRVGGVADGAVGAVEDLVVGEADGKGPDPEVDEVFVQEALTAFAEEADVLLVQKFSKAV